MKVKAKSLTSGTITSPRGFLAGATYAGLKTGGDNILDLGILFSEVPCTAAGLFTTNKVKAAPLVLSQERLLKERAQAIVVNSGCANACTGVQGLADAAEMASLAAQKLGIAENEILVASTGVIGVPLPMEKVRAGIVKIALSPAGGHELARAIMSTDTFAKETALTVNIGRRGFTIGGIAKGAGMIHPDLATMLCFLSTDAAVEAGFLQSALREAVDDSFNMITIDGDTSTNDMVLILANGLSSTNLIGRESGEAEVFQAALKEVCLYFAKSIARDGEGASRLIEVTVEGALNKAEARRAAGTVAGSSLVKAAVHGSDPNWGRIAAALGRSGAEMMESKLDLYLDNICLMKSGQPVPFDASLIRAVLASPEVTIRAHLNLGQGTATAWGCDLSEEYVTINSAYTT